MNLGRLNVATVWALVILGSAGNFAFSFQELVGELQTRVWIWLRWCPSFCKCGSGARLRRVLQGMRLQAKLGFNLDGKGSLTRASVFSRFYLQFELFRSLWDTQLELPSCAMKWLEANRSMVESLMEGQPWPKSERVTGVLPIFPKRRFYQRFMMFPAACFAKHFWHLGLNKKACNKSQYS